jgi:hypothetical protein
MNRNVSTEAGGKIKMKRKLQIIIGIIQAFVALGAIPAGLSMIVQPDGSGLGMTIDLLAGSPFNDFFIPGLFLFSVNGILNLAAALLSFFKFRYTGIFGAGLGMALIAWVGIQAYSIGLISFMQPMFFFIGTTELILAFLLLKNKS